MICKKCGNEIPQGKPKCPNCGAEASYVVTPPPLNSGLPSGRSATTPVTPMVSLPAEVRSYWPICHLAVILLNVLMLFFWFTGHPPLADSYSGAGWINWVLLILCAVSALLSLASSLLKPAGRAVRLAVLAVQLAAALWALGVFWAAAIPLLAQGSLTADGGAFALFSLLLFAPLGWMLAHSRK